MFKEGKIYRVSGHALDPQEAKFWEINRDIVRTDGWLWVLAGKEQQRRSGFHEFRSLATGKIEQFTEYELEEADAEEG
jgi:hypothetical protein